MFSRAVGFGTTESQIRADGRIEPGILDGPDCRRQARISLRADQATKPSKRPNPEGFQRHATAANLEFDNMLFAIRSLMMPICWALVTVTVIVFQEN
jgi:hypothetical protein